MKLGPHQQAVLDAIAQAGRPVSVGEVAAAVGVHRNSAGNLLKKLEDKGLIRVAHVTSSAATGRPAAHFILEDWSSCFRPRPDPAAAWMFGGRDAA